MEKKYFPLGAVENSRIIKIIRIAFGVVCLIVAGFWINFNISSLKTDPTLWVSIIFLFGFGLFQVWSGIGRATRFIEIGQHSIHLKKNAIMPSVEIIPSDIERIEIFPLNIVFYFRTKKRILLRLGITYHEQNELILDEIIGFAMLNNIKYEVIEEKI